MSEPDWNQFKVDDLFDSVGAKQQKLFDFMHAFIEWQQVKVPNIPKKQKRKRSSK